MNANFFEQKQFFFFQFGPLENYWVVACITSDVYIHYTINFKYETKEKKQFYPTFGVFNPFRLLEKLEKIYQILLTQCFAGTLFSFFLPAISHAICTLFVLCNFSFNLIKINNHVNGTSRVCVVWQIFCTQKLGRHTGRIFDEEQNNKYGRASRYTKHNCFCALACEILLR